MSMSKKLVSALALSVAFGAVGGCTVVSDREVAVRTTLGSAGAEFNKGSGAVFFVPLFQSVYSYPLYVQTFDVKADQAHLMTKDNQPIIGAVRFQYEIKEEKGSATRLFSKYNYTDGEHLGILHQFAQDSTVAVFGKQPALNLTSSVDAVMDMIKKELQSKLDAGNVPFKVVAVNSAGIGLSADSIQKLEGLMLEQQRATTLDVREKNAEKAKGVAKKEAEVTAAAMKALRESGIPEDKILNAYCLQLAEKEGSVNQPFTPGCLGNAGSGFSVAVPKMK